MLPAQTGIEGYPVIIEATQARRQSSLITWRLFLAAHGTRQVEPDFHPVLMTPQSIPSGLVGKVKVTSTAEELTEESARDALRTFIKSEMPLLVGGDRTLVPALKDLSLVNFETTGEGYAATYRELSFGYPIVGGYGNLEIRIKRNGEIIKLHSTLFPRIPFPARPQADVTRFSEALKDREFTYTGIAGRPLKYRVGASDPINVKELVVYPKEEENRILLYLAYPVEVGQGTTFTVFFDAVTGDELDARPNFVS